MPTLTERLKKYHEDKTKIFINGMGPGTILSVESDYIEFGMSSDKDSFENVLIPISSISSVSEGERKKQVTLGEKAPEVKIRDMGFDKNTEGFA